MPSIRGLEMRSTLRGRWASSETMSFVQMDAENAQRVGMGSPPIISYESHDGSLSLPWPAVGSMYGFVRPVPTFQGMPTSLSALALRIVQQVTVENRSPLPVTVTLWLDNECNCTEAEAKRLFREN